MQVFVRPAIEPGSYASRNSRLILAENAIADRLRRIVRRYIAGELTGRSFLISGHRGAGKTTLVRKVIQDLDLDVSTGAPAFGGGPPQRPLLVVLPGPMLLPPGQPGGEDEAGVVLQFITLNLYRALARWFADRYEALALERGEAELAAAFRLKMDGYVSLAELRGFWSSLDALEKGIVQPKGVGGALQQGPREIVALWSCLRAYLSLSGKYEEAAGGRDGAEAKTEASLRSGEKGMLTAMAAAVTGGLTGAGSAAAHKDPLFTVCASLASAAAAALVVSFSGSRSRSSSDSLQSKITLERDLKTLTRELPELIMRCRDAGIVPVFLIDELDKVERLEQRMESLVRNTKFFVTEQALFFFVTDRAYYEYLEALSRDRAYPREYTFFSQRLFVAYQPEDWRRYVLELLVVPDDHHGKFVADALSFILLCRARMHAIDLRRELAKITCSAPPGTLAHDVESQVTEEHLNVTELRFQMEILMQVAVEVTYFEDPNLHGRCAGEPPFTQVVYDALYYPARQWANEPAEEFSLDAERFGAYIAARTKTLSGEGAHDELPFLHRKMRRLMVWLGNPQMLHEAMRAPHLQQRFPDSIASCVRTAPPLISQSAGGFRWRYDVYGRSMNPAGLEEVLNNAELWAAAEAVARVDEKLRAVTNGQVSLTAMQQAGLMDPSPAVADVMASMARLNAMSAQQPPSAYREMDADAENVMRFGGDLRTRGAALTRLLVATLRLEGFASGDGEDRLRDAWAIVCEWAGRDMTPEQLAGRAQAVFSVLMVLDFAGREQPVPGVEQMNVQAWSEWLDAAAKGARLDLSLENQRAGMEAVAWQGWQRRVGEWLTRGVPSYDGPDEQLREEIICAARRWGPGRLLRPNLPAISCAEWAALLLGRTPAWARFVAASMIGADETAVVIAHMPDNAEPLDRTAEPLRSWIRENAGQRRQRVKVIAVREAEQGVTARWLPQAGYAILAVTIQQWSTIAIDRSPNPLLFSDSLMFPPAGFVFYEPHPKNMAAVSGPVQIPAALANLNLRPELADARWGLIAGEFQPDAQAPGVVAMPKSASEAVERLSQLPRWNPFFADPVKRPPSP